MEDFFKYTEMSIAPEEVFHSRFHKLHFATELYRALRIFSTSILTQHKEVMGHGFFLPVGPFFKFDL